MPELNTTQVKNAFGGGLGIIPDSMTLNIKGKMPEEGNIKSTSTSDDNLENLDDLDKDDLEELKAKNKDLDKDKNLDKDKDKDLDLDKDKDKDKEVDDSIISVLKGKFGEVEGEFEESLEGMTSYTEKVISKKVEEAKAEAQLEVFESKPLVKALVEHLEAGFGIESFMQETQLVDWDFQLKSLTNKEDELNEPLAKQIFWMAREAKGMDKDEIQDAWDTAKDKGVVKERTEKSIEFLKKEQDKLVADQKALEKKAYDKQIEDNTKWLKGRKELYKSGKILGLDIPPEKMKELEKFTLEFDKKGESARDKRIAAATDEEMALIDLMLANNFKDLGIKPKTVASNDAFKKMKEAEAAKKKANLGGGTNLTTSERNNINVRTLFNNN